MKLLKRFTPKSVERQLNDKPIKRHTSNARFVDCIIEGKVVRINARCLPDDLPSVEHWLWTKFVNERLNGTSLTG